MLDEQWSFFATGLRRTSMESTAGGLVHVGWTDTYWAVSFFFFPPQGWNHHIFHSQCVVHLDRMLDLRLQMSSAEQITQRIY